MGTVGEKMKLARSRIQADLSDVSLRNYDLIKEASALTDAMTADKILGLGFINPENIASFVDSIPAFEQVSSTLAEMLIAVRLGMQGPPELAIERALVALEDNIQGLRRLKQKEITFQTKTASAKSIGQQLAWKGGAVGKAARQGAQRSQVLKQVSTQARRASGSPSNLSSADLLQRLRRSAR
jgi:hypothetical protein